MYTHTHTDSDIHFALAPHILKCICEWGLKWICAWGKRHVYTHMHTHPRNSFCPCCPWAAYLWVHVWMRQVTYVYIRIRQFHFLLGPHILKGICEWGLKWICQWGTSHMYTYIHTDPRISLLSLGRISLSGSVNEASDNCIHICIWIREIHVVLMREIHVVLELHHIQWMCAWITWRMHVCNVCTRAYASKKFTLSLSCITYSGSVHEWVTWVTNVCTYAYRSKKFTLFNESKLP